MFKQIISILFLLTASCGVVLADDDMPFSVILNNKIDSNVSLQTGDSHTVSAPGRGDEHHWIFNTNVPATTPQQLAPKGSARFDEDFDDDNGEAPIQFGNGIITTTCPANPQGDTIILHAKSSGVDGGLVTGHNSGWNGHDGNTYIVTFQWWYKDPTAKHCAMLTHDVKTYPYPYAAIQNALVAFDILPFPQSLSQS